MLLIILRGLALGTMLGIVALHDNDKLALRLVGLEVGDTLGNSATHRLLELLGYLPHHSHTTLITHGLGNLLQALDNTIW